MQVHEFRLLVTFEDVFDRTHLADNGKGSNKDEKLVAIAVIFCELLKFYSICGIRNEQFQVLTFEIMHSEQGLHVLMVIHM